MTKRWKFIRACLSNIGYTTIESLENVTPTRIDVDGTLYYTDGSGNKMMVKYPSKTPISVGDDGIGFTTLSFDSDGVNFEFEINGTNASFTMPMFITSDELVSGPGYDLPGTITYTTDGSEVTYLSNSATTTPTLINSGEQINALLDYDNTEFYFRGLEIDGSPNDVRLKFLKFQTQWYVESLTLLTSGFEFGSYSYSNSRNFYVENGKNLNDYFGMYYYDGPSIYISGYGSDGEILDFTLRDRGRITTNPTAVTELFLNAGDSDTKTLSSATFAVTWSNDLIIESFWEHAMVGYEFNQRQTLYGGTLPFNLTVESGTIPDGLEIINQYYLGTPVSAGTYNFDIKVTDYYGNEVQTGNTITVFDELMFITGSGDTGSTALPSGTTGSSYSTEIDFTDCYITTWWINQDEYAPSSSAIIDIGGLHIKMNEIESGTGIRNKIIIDGTPTESQYSFDIILTSDIPLGLGGGKGNVMVSKTFSIDIL